MRQRGNETGQGGIPGRFQCDARAKTVDGGTVGASVRDPGSTGAAL